MSDAFMQLVIAHPDTTLGGMGAQAIYDYAQDKPDFNDRLGRCYELAAKAMLEVPQPPGAPVPLLLLHGKWRGPTAKEAIGHALVNLSNGYFWEPITKSICEPHQFMGYTRWQTLITYDAVSARRHMRLSEHYGPWHEGAL